MEEIIDQKFSYASIIPYKSYCRIDSKGSSVNEVDDDFERIMNREIDRQKPIRIGSDEDGLPVIDMSNIPIFCSHEGKMIEIEPKGTRKRKIMSFYTDKSDGDRVYLQYAFQDKSSKNHQFYTSDDDVIKKFFGDPFTYIGLNTYERSIRRHGDKITIKLYRHSKYRDINWKFFKRSNSIRSLTFNMVTGNFTTTTISTISTTPKHKIKRFRTNNFYELYDLIFNTSYLFNSEKNDFKYNTGIGSQFISVFNNADFLSAVAIGLDIKQISDLKELYSNIIRKFSYLKKIKTPDVYEKLLTEVYPTEKFLKKNNRKLIASILDFAGIKSKFTIKLFHEYTINIFSFVQLCYLFGDDYPKYLGNLRKEIYVRETPKDYVAFPIEAPFMISTQALEEQKNRDFTVTDIEKENLIRLLNSDDSPRRLGNDLMIYIYDHFNMIKTLREYYPEIYFKAKTYGDFEVEHRYFSKVISTIKKGWVTEYVYKKELIEEIEQPLLIEQMLLPVCADDAYFYPTILKREEEFIDEGAYMHHCVASYSDNNRSIIISLRSKDSSERITCEFNIKTGEIVQAKYKCNAQPPEIFLKPLEELKLLVRKQVYKDTLQWEEKKKVNVVINGVEVIKPTENINRHAQYYAELPVHDMVEMPW